MLSHGNLVSHFEPVSLAAQRVVVLWGKRAREYCTWNLAVLNERPDINIVDKINNLVLELFSCCLDSLVRGKENMFCFKPEASKLSL